MAIQGRSIEERFWSKVDRKGPQECWPWLAFRNPTGYGQISFQRKLWQAHRLAYHLVKGELPAGAVVLHECDNPWCVNPAHLSLGTQADNIKDCVAKGRQSEQQKTHCSRGHEFTPANTTIYKNKRQCKACQLHYQRIRREAQKQLKAGQRRESFEPDPYFS